MDTAPEPFVGRTIGQYEIVAKRGGGGMGLVYTARDTRLGRVVALKFLPPQWSHDETAKQRFVREAQAASATDHRNICTIHDIRTADDGQLFIVMAHYDGPTLKQRLESGALPIDEAIDIAAQVAEGLAKAHGQGIVHRDIKPGNLILTEDSVKILDFGLAKFADAVQLTIAGSTLGTMAYMSPEQVRAEEADARSDIWAVGVVLYEMLAGSVPFKGAYAEAIFHAIRNQPAPPIERSGAAIPEPLWRIVSRCLEKDPAARYQSARELARELRLLQGRTLPIELRTEYVSVPPQLTASRTVWWKRPSTLVATALVVAILVAALRWLVESTDRLRVAIVPVINLTGDAELTPARMALTAMLVHNLVDSDAVRVPPYEQLLQIVRRFAEPGRDVSSSEAIQALTQHTGARVVVVPTLLFDNGALRARVEFRDPTTGTSFAARETPPVANALSKVAALDLLPELVAEIDDQSAALGSWRQAIAYHLRRVMHRRPAVVHPVLTLDAAAAFAQALDDYEQQEYAKALTEFTRAGALDPQSPVAAAWRSRVARIMRHDNEAAEAARRAEQLVTPDTPPLHTLFVRAVTAEARTKFSDADANYRELIARHADDVAWRLEAAGMLDRAQRTTEAVAAYYDVLRRDSTLVRPHLELCRLYGPLKLHDGAKAKQQGDLALRQYRALGARAGEAQALWCLADALNGGNRDEQNESRADADRARAIFEELAYPYNLSRAFNYVALAAAAQGNFTQAVDAWTTSLKWATATANEALRPAIVSNLAVMYSNLGDLPHAVSSLQEGYRLYEALGDRQRAAQNKANAARLAIDYGVGDIDQAVRDLASALRVFEQVDDKNFQIFAHEVLASYAANTGRHDEARRELNRAEALAQATDSRDVLPRIRIAVARTRLEESDYTSARALLVQALGNGTGSYAGQARILLALTDVRLGGFDEAGDQLRAANSDLARGRDATLAPMLHEVEGELAFESDRNGDARRHFAEAIHPTRQTLPSEASVVALAYLALIDGIEGAIARARVGVVESLGNARRMRRLALEARCLTFLAQLDLRTGQAAQALKDLAEIPPDGADRSIGRELRAQVHLWRARALAASGDDRGAETAAAMARDTIEAIRATLPESMRERFGARRQIRVFGR